MTKAASWWKGKPPPRPGVVRGEQQGQAKLTDQIVRECRLAHKHGWSHAALSRKFKVSVYAMWAAVKRRTWKHVA